MRGLWPLAATLARVKPSPGTDQEVGGDYKANVDPE